MITLQQFYDLSLDLAIKRSPRSVADIKEQLKKLKQQYDKMDDKEKQYFDKEWLRNPFTDSRVEFGAPSTKLKRILTGIDCGTSEILVANELNKRGRKIDAVISHHPEGSALTGLTRVMDLQADIAESEGVPPNVAEKLMEARISDLDRRIHPTNFYQVPAAAELLEMPYACFHTFADNQVWWFMKNYITKNKPKYVNEIMDLVMEVPEFQMAKKLNNGPIMYAGNEKGRAGKISFSGYTGGTSGSADIYEKMAMAGVGTILAMHMPEDHRKNCEKYQINVLITGHMASDSLGMNLLLDEAEKKGTEIVPCGGLLRVSRVGKKLPF